MTPDELARLIEEQPYRHGDRVRHRVKRGDTVYTVDRVRKFTGREGHWNNRAEDLLTVMFMESGHVAPPSELEFVELPERLRKRGLAQLVSRYQREGG